MSDTVAWLFVMLAGSLFPASGIRSVYDTHSS